MLPSFIFVISRYLDNDLNILLVDVQKFLKHENYSLQEEDDDYEPEERKKKKGKKRKARSEDKKGKKKKKKKKSDSGDVRKRYCVYTCLLQIYIYLLVTHDISLSLYNSIGMVRLHDLTSYMKLQESDFGGGEAAGGDAAGGEDSDYAVNKKSRKSSSRKSSSHNTPTTQSQEPTTGMPTIEEVCNTFGLTDVQIEYSDADFQNLTTYKLFQQHVRPLLAKENPKVRTLYDCLAASIMFTQIIISVFE